MGQRDDQGGPERTESPSDGGRWWRRPLWALFWAVGAVSLAFVLWFIWLLFGFFTSDDPFHSHSEIGCAAAMSFAQGELPDDVTDEDCAEDSWMDTAVRGTFRMPRAQVRPWLERAYPDVRPEKYCDEDVCLDISFGPDETSGAAEVRISVRYAAGGAAVVTLDAFTT